MYFRSLLAAEIENIYVCKLSKHSNQLLDTDE